MAQGNLSACLAVNLAYEGGLSMDRSDPGNWTGGKVGLGTLKGTNFGIAAASHPSLDIAHLTKADAEAIYAHDYWTPAGCEALPAGLDLSHFDGTVNSGRGRAATWLAASGPAVGGTADRIRTYASRRLGFLEALSTWRRFSKGWGARVASVEAKSLRLALGPSAAASATIARAAAAHAAKATVRTTAAHAGTATGAGASALAAAHHPFVAAAVGALALLCALALAFAGWRNTIRASALAHEAAAHPAA